MKIGYHSALYLGTLNVTWWDGRHEHLVDAPGQTMVSLLSDH